MVKKLKVENYRGIKVGELGPFGRVNVFVGPNGGGKTAVLEALYLLNLTKLPEVLSREVSYMVPEGPNFSDLKRDVIGVLLRKHARFGPSCVPSGALENFFSEEGFFFSGESRLKIIAWTDERKRILEFDKTRRTVEREPARGEPLIDAFFVDEHIKDDTEDFGALWDAVLESGQEEEFFKTFNEVYLPVIGQELRNIFVRNREIKVKLAHSYAFFQHLADGAKSGMVVLILLLLLEKGLFLYDEPENFQNPSSLERLTHLMLKVMKEKPIQGFFATHSAEFLEFALRSAEELGYKPEDLMVFHLELVKGKLVSERYNLKEAKAITEAGGDLRRLFETSGAWEDEKA